MLAIIDIDGTLACIKNRMKIAGTCPNRNNRKAFQQWLDKLQSPETLAQDELIFPVAHTVKALLHNGAKVVFLTGRSEKYRKVTQEWLNNFGFKGIKLLMRNNNDWRKARDYKEYKIKKLLKELKVPKGAAILTIDDDYDQDCSEMYTKLGIVHLKVMPTP